MKAIRKDACGSIKEVVKRNISEFGYSDDIFFGNNMFPYIKNLGETASFILNWINENPDGEISVIGDYDSDGVNATAILYHGFKYLGKDIHMRIPKRFSEGYGFNDNIIDEIDSGLLITVDNGIAAISAIKKAKDKGLDVIVIDHHLPVKDKEGNIILPDADLIVDPAVEDESAFHNYCGGALAWRLVKEMLPDMQLKELLVLASIATVTDVMPLYGANRALVQQGLELANANRMVPGLQELLKVFCQNRKLTCDNTSSVRYHLTEEDYGFLVGPAFNASGRLSDTGANQTLKLLTADRDDARIEWKAAKLFRNNEKRKEIVKEDMERVRVSLSDDRPIVLYDEAIGEGIIGIIAGQLCEKYNCPAIVFTKTEKDGIIKGSGRSPKEIHLKEALDKIQSLIIGYGGHAGAAGLSIKLADLKEFTKSFKEACGKLPEISSDKIEYDLELNADNLEPVMKELKEYAPFGEGNPKIRFRLKYKTNATYSKIGDDQTHLMIRDDNLTLVGFGLAGEYEKLGCPKSFEVVGYLSDSWYNSSRSLKFEIKGFITG